MKLLDKRNKNEGNGLGAGRLTSRRFSLAPNSILLLIAILISAVGNLEGQSFGGGIDGAKSVGTCAGCTPTLKTDNVSFRVGNQTGTWNCTFTAPTGNTFSGISVGDIAVVVQMVGGTIGTYYQNYVTAVSSTSITLSYPSPLAPAPTFVFTLSPFDRVQIIRVPQYSSVDIYDNGILTCNNFQDIDPYNPGTGGVVDFVCNGTLTFHSTNPTIAGEILAGQDNKATVTVSGSGYNNVGAVGTGGGTDPGHGYGGAMGADGTDHTNSASTCLPGNPAASPCPTGTTGGTGGAGGSANTFGLSGGTGNPPTYVFSVSPTYKVYMPMGQAGNTGNGGMGGGSGGGGGGGGISCGGGGTPGGDGHFGAGGGNGGNGGFGGGVIYIRAQKIVTADVTIPEIIANGTDGGNGVTPPGGYGSGYGTGGVGGNPDKGCCSPTTTGGGGGNHGCTGNGASAGNGGNGGNGGTIWIAYQTGYSDNLTTANLLANGGAGGAGGTGAAPDQNTHPGGLDITNMCDCGSSYCGSVDTIYHDCDPYDTYCYLSQMTSGSISSGIITYTNSTDYCTYNNNMIPGLLKCVHNAGTTNPGSCTGPSITTYDVYDTRVSANTPCYALLGDMVANMGGTCSGSGNIPFNAGSTYYPGSHYLNQATLYCDDGCVCHGDCPLNGYNGTAGTAGSAGSVPSVGYPEEPSDAMHPLVINQNLFMMDSNMINTVAMQPNPAHNVVNLSFKASFPASYTIQVYDLNGKLLFSGPYAAIAGPNTYGINIGNFAPGHYICRMITDKGVLSENKFIVQ